VLELTQQVFAGDDPDLQRKGEDREKAPWSGRRAARAPFRFDITRRPNRHLGFGTGEHFCLGAHVARMSIRALLQEMGGRVLRLEHAGESSQIGFLRRVAGGGRFDACPPAIRESLARAETIFEDLLAESGAGLELITRCSHTMLNSGFQNVKALRELRGAQTNPLYMNPRDAGARGLCDGQPVIARNADGELRAELALDSRLREGVVATSHGFGNERTSGMPVAQVLPGVNVNALSPTGAGSFDPVGGMGYLTGIPVEVEGAA
jgi:hypothetical protein